MDILKTLEKHWPLISISLLIVLLTSLWLWPAIQGFLSLAIIFLSVGMLLAFTIHRRLEESRQGALDRSMMWRMILLDVIGVLLVLGIAMVVGSTVSDMVGTEVYSALLASAPKWADAAALVSGLVAALVAGVGVGWLVRSAWRRVETLILERQEETSAT